MPAERTHLYHGFTELLPWLFIADEDCRVICNKDSSLLAAWEFTGVDVESGYSGLLEETCMGVDRILREISEYLPVVWSRVDRRPTTAYPYGSFRQEVAMGIDRAWAETIESSPMFTNRHYIAVSMPVAAASLSLAEAIRENMDAGMKPARAFFTALVNRFVGGQKRFGFTTREELDIAIRRFEQFICAPFDAGGVGFETRRLSGRELLGFLKSTVSTSHLAPVAVDHYEYLDAYLSDSFLDNRYSDYLVLEGQKKQYIAAFSLKKAPSDNDLQFLRRLLSLPVSMTVASVWKTVSQHDAEKFLNGVRTFDEMRSWEVRKLIRRAFSGGELIDDGSPKTEVGKIAMEMKEEVRRNRAVCGWLATSVLVYADNPRELSLACEMVMRELEKCGLVFIREREGALSAFCVGIPGQLTEPVRWHFVEAANLTDVTPLISLSSGEPYHPFFSEGREDPVPPNAVFRTRYNTPFFFNYHLGQLGHTLLIGPSRNGKTMLQMFLESQFLKYDNAYIFNFDKDHSLKPQTYLLDGAYIDLDPGKGEVKLNPLAVAKDEMGRAWLIGWIDRLMSYRGEKLNERDISHISDAIRRVIEIPGVRLSSLLSQLPEALRARLTPWCEGGPWGAYFDNKEDTFSLVHPITTTEVGSVLNAGLTEVVRAFTDYAFYRIERHLMNRKESEIGPTMIYFEEAGFLLEDEIFAQKARDYLMTLAKKRAFLVMTAQSPEPFILHPRLGAAVRDNVATIIFMPNAQAEPGRDLALKYKQAFGVNDNHLELIASATPREEYCIFRPQTGFFRVVNARFPPEIVAALRSDAKTQALFQRVFDPKDALWKEKYLQLAASV